MTVPPNELLLIRAIQACLRDAKADMVTAEGSAASLMTIAKNAGDWAGHSRAYSAYSALICARAALHAAHDKCSEAVRAQYPGDDAVTIGLGPAR